VGLDSGIVGLDSGIVGLNSGVGGLVNCEAVVGLTGILAARDEYLPKKSGDPAITVRDFVGLQVPPPLHKGARCQISVPYSASTALSKLNTPSTTV
jgi:hypothetical protein